MKRICIACAILLSLLVGTLLHSFYIGAFARDLTLMLEEAEARAEAEDWESAAELTQTMRDKWESRQLYLHIALRHDATDAIYTGVREVQEFIECEEGGEYSAANARLIAGLELLSGAEQLSLQNIL